MCSVIDDPTTRWAALGPAQWPQHLSEDPDRWLVFPSFGPSLAELRSRLRSEMTLLTGTTVVSPSPDTEQGKA
jgi:hypothetical protein